MLSSYVVGGVSLSGPTLTTSAAESSGSVYVWTSERPTPFRVTPSAREEPFKDAVVADPVAVSERTPVPSMALYAVAALA
ncbi:hypothetical protein [Streptomyces sp. NPDC050548]|uniref:hypothetical protein n=1 Tax=Streptomyces sp. NPDC050548 TaxID=3365629 RepID=UPI0037A69D64